METVILCITLLVTNLITNLILVDFFLAKYKLRYGKKSIIIYLSCAVILTVLINLLNNSTYNLILYITLFIALNYLVFELEKAKDILINISFFIVVFLLLDTLCYVLVVTTMKLLSNNNTFLEMNLKIIIASLMRYVIYNVLKNFMLKKEINTLSKLELISYAVGSLFSLAVMYVFTLFSDVAKSDANIFYFVVCIGILFINVWCVYALESLSKKTELERLLYLANEQSKLLYKHYQKLEEKEEQRRLLLHDLKNHIQILEKSTIELKDTKRNYVDEFKERINDLTTEVIVDQRILNILFLEKKEEASKYHIEIIFNIEDADISFIKDFDLVTIFSNLLDNAIDAVKTLDKDKRTIELTIKRVHDFLLVCEMNPCTNMLIKQRGRVITSKKDHKGLGLESIRHTLLNYDANMVIEIDENMIFSNTITFTI